MNDGVTAEQLRGMLLLRQTEQQAKVEEEQACLARLRLRLGLIDKENSMIDVILKQVPAQWIASVRETIPNYPSVSSLYAEVAGALPPGSFGTSAAIWHDPEYRETNIDAEAGFFLPSPITQEQMRNSGRVQVYELPPITAASVIHHGAYNRLSEAYDSLLRWVGGNGYSIAAPPRELYL